MSPHILSKPLTPRGPHGHPITKLVIHAMGQFVRKSSGDVGVPAHEHLAAQNRSAHALIEPDGTLIECVGREQKAWHVKDMNAGKLGIELLVAGAHDYNSFARTVGWDLLKWEPRKPLPFDPYTVAQYETLGWWLAREARIAGLGWEAVTSHQELMPTVKFDPGPVFDWNRLEQRFTLERELAA